LDADISYEKEMVFIAAGSSVHFCAIDSQQIVLSAFLALGRVLEMRARSPLYRSPAWPDPLDPPFVNAVASFETKLPPEGVLAALHAVEAGFGRRRSKKNAPRTLDLDFLAWGDMRASGGDRGLVLPHPRLHERDFVLAPLCDLAPDWRHPSTGLTAREMLAAVPRRTAARIA
jgi:2-amino-4-hydroxy-6-hydroxymethyldihydropteridine diphosphokinase